MCDSFSIEGEALVTELCTQGGGRCVPCVEAWDDLDIVHTPVASDTGGSRQEYGNVGALYFICVLID